MSNINFMDEINALIDQHIDEEYQKTWAEIGENPDYKADRDNLNGLFAKARGAYAAAQREMYFFIERAGDNFYTKGFWAGMKFVQGLSGEEDTSQNDTV